MRTIQALLDKHQNRQPISAELFFSRFKTLAQQLNITHKRMGKVIQIAGTNGKGSTQHYLWDLLKASGKSCHVYTSPHLVHVNERIILNNELINDELFVEALMVVDQVASEALGYFAFITLAAFYLFCKIPADYVLLETGIGGHYDSTNILDDHAMSIITPIGLDHCAFLGDTIDKIAYEKACIQRTGRPCIVAPQTASAQHVIKQKSKALESTLYVIDSGIYRQHDTYFMLDNEKYDQPSLQGVHQMMNAAVAIKAYFILMSQKNALDSCAVNQVLRQTHFLGRLHAMLPGRLTQQLKHDLWIDGAHNPAAATALTHFLEKQHKPLYLWCRFKADKDYAHFLEIIAPYCARLVYQYAPMLDVVCDNDIQAIAASNELACYTSLDIQTSIAHFNELPSGLILACGSLHWIGDLLSLN